jgi:hypothetical protein
VRKEALRLMIVDDEEAARYGMRRALTPLATTSLKPDQPKPLVLSSSSKTLIFCCSM